MAGNANARSRLRQGFDVVDPWSCGGTGTWRVEHHVCYCGITYPVPSLAEDCEVLHEAGYP